MSLGAPKAPDPYATAAAQSQQNEQSIRQAAQYNQINQTSPFGSVTYTGALGSPDRTQVTSLSPELQALLGGQTQISQGLTDLSNQRLAGIPREGFQAPTDPNGYMSGGPQVQQLDARANNPLQTTFGMGGDLTRNVQGGQMAMGVADAGQVQRGVNLSGQPQLIGGQDLLTQRKGVEDALYNRATSRLDPRFAQQEQALQSRLANQGITQGSDAYNTEMANFGQNRNDAYSSAMNDAIMGAGQEQTNLFGMGLQARQQGVGEQFGLGEFANQAQGQQYGQNLSNAQFQNQAQNQQFGQGMQNAQLNNQSAMQDYARNMGAAQFSNDANGQQFNQGMDLMNYNQGAIGQNFNQNLATQGFNQNEYQRQLSNQIQGRNQNFNELAAFLNGSPIAPNNPTFQNTAQYSPQGVPIGDYINQNYQTQSGMRNALFSALGNVAGAAGSAAIMTCCVAREVYGVDNPRWMEFRHWMLHIGPKWFRSLYLKYGPNWAAWLRNKPRAKAIVRRMMEAVLG